MKALFLSFRFLLPFERHLRGTEGKATKKGKDEKSNSPSNSESLDLSDKDSKSPDAGSGKENEKDEENDAKDFAKPKELDTKPNGTDDGKIAASSILSTEVKQ